MNPGLLAQLFQGKQYDQMRGMPGECDQAGPPGGQQGAGPPLQQEAGNLWDRGDIDLMNPGGGGDAGMLEQLMRPQEPQHQGPPGEMFVDEMVPDEGPGGGILARLLGGGKGPGHEFEQMQDVNAQRLPKGTKEGQFLPPNSITEGPLRRNGRM